MCFHNRGHGHGGLKRPSSRRNGAPGTYYYSRLSRYAAERPFKGSRLQRARRTFGNAIDQAADIGLDQRGSLTPCSTFLARAEDHCAEARSSRAGKAPFIARRARISSSIPDDVGV
jgi:hypothetical protein